ncbi:hypothetical protein [Frigidibacter sp. SD6-1]|uniref:hypothetical protein n=1 Tax=Frigidibacter sp. SD6-1 TaxID=3032581 RepID=UPI0024DFCE78|nr:hypothetical protein [Frigidibacter sp. SD6-1]
MKPVFAAALLGLSTLPAGAEVKEQHVVVGDWQVWIEPVDPLELLFVGRNEFERDQLLSGGDLEVVGMVADADDVALLGMPAIVVETPGTQSCDDIDAVARDYYVISFDGAPRLSTPAMTCADLTLSVTNGMLVLEADPMGVGEFWSWTPEAGFVLR